MELASSSPRVWLKAYWGFNPEEASYLGFTKEGFQKRFLEMGQENDLVMIYGAGSEFTAKDDVQRILGFLEVSLEPIRDIDRMSDAAILRKKQNGWQDKWTYAVPVRRAWRVHKNNYWVKYIAPETYIPSQSRLLGSGGELLTPSDTSRALDLPVIPTNVFGEPPVNMQAKECTMMEVFQPSRGINPSFGTRNSVYEDGDHFLYILEAKGCVAALLGKSPSEINKKSLIKIGFSNSPERRCAEHNASLPNSSHLHWKLFAQSRRYFDGQSAKNAEDILKQIFDKKFESLGGEFFFGDTEKIFKEFFLVPGATLRTFAPSV